MSINHPKSQGMKFRIIIVIILPFLSKLLSTSITCLTSYASEYKSVKEKSDDANRISFEEINEV